MVNNKQKGFVVRRGDFHYSFLHDRVQEAAKSAIPDKVMTQLHLEIGLFLLDKIKNLKRNLRVILFNPIKLYLPFLFLERYGGIWYRMCRRKQYIRRK